MKLILAILAVGLLAGCGSKFRTYDGPAVTQVVVDKSARRMYLMHHDTALETYDIGLGFTPTGHKLHEGDGRTPVGSYIIDRRNPNSSWHLSIGLSYPNEVDVATAEAFGLSPGGNIFIHGTPHNIAQRDWTWGCIAVSNREMETIYAMVPNGTPITLYD